MADGRSNRRNKVVAFVDRLGKDRAENYNALLQKAKKLELDGFDKVKWIDISWTITKGRLTKSTGKNIQKSAFYFQYSPSLGKGTFTGKWGGLAKALFMLRFHRKNQAAANQRNFITAFGYIAYSAVLLKQNIDTLTPEALDAACRLISKHYAKSTAYNLQKAVGEVAGHCDANGLSRIMFKFRYVKMKRPDNVGGIEYKRLDDPDVLNTQSDKLIQPLVFEVLGSLFQNVPKDHKYRFYILLLTLLATTGRRYSEISLLPHQKIKKDFDGRSYLLYFPRKMSQGDIFTPYRKLYFISDALPIIRDVVEELDILCAPARDTAAEMQLTKSADLRFLIGIENSKRLYKRDLVELNVSPTVLEVTGWIRKTGYTTRDLEQLSKTGKKIGRPTYFTNTIGVAAYCNKDFQKTFIEELHIDQNGKYYYLKDMLLVRYQNHCIEKHWVATQCTHSMLANFLKSFPRLAEEYADSSIEVNFNSHDFRHTLNTLLDEGGLSDLLQTKWFGRSNPRDTKAYQHTSRGKRVLMLREDIKKGRAGGKLADMVQNLPIDRQDAVLKARVQAVHDVGPGVCVHNFSQTPCGRHLQCSAECDDYAWAKDDKGRIPEQKRLLAFTILASETCEKQLKSKKPKKSSDWIAHNNKKIKTLTTQLKDNGVVNFDPSGYLKEIGIE